MLAAEVSQAVRALEFSKARSVDRVFQKLAEMKDVMLQWNDTQTSNTAIFELITRAEDGSEIATYAYRVTDRSIEVSFEEVVIDLPVVFLQDLQEASDDPIVLSLATVHNGSYAYQVMKKTGEMEKLQMLVEPVSMTFYGNNGTITEIDSEAPVELSFKVDSAEPLLARAECAFWNAIQNRWERTGMKLAGAENGTATCEIRYDQLPTLVEKTQEVSAMTPRKPSLFGLIARTFLDTFACSLAASIYSLEGLASLVRSSDWVLRPAALTTWTILVAAVGLLLVAHRSDRKYEKHLEMLLSKETARQMLMEQAKKEFVLFRRFRELRAQKLHDEATKSVHWSIIRARLGVDSDFLRSLYEVSGQTALHRQARELLEDFYNHGVFQQVFILYRSCCQWLQVLEPSLRVTCLERSAVALCKLMSGFGVAAVFYNQGSVATGQQGCDFGRDPLVTIIRSAVVCLVSSAVGLLPFLVLMPLFEKLRSFELKMRHIVFWTFTSVYFLFCLLTVCIFHASVSNVDGLDWAISALLSLLFSLIMTPLMMAAALRLLLSSTTSDLDEHLPFHPHNDDCYKVTLQKMSISGNSLLKHLASNSSTTLCARWEIAGHPETAAISDVHTEDGDGEIVLDGVMPHHAVLVSVYANSGAMRLLGNSVLPSKAFLENGFEGHLPLLRNGKPLQDAHVGVLIAPPVHSQIQHVPVRGRSSIRLTIEGSGIRAFDLDSVEQCEDAGISFYDDIFGEADFQQHCEALGIDFDSESEGEDQDPASEGFAVIPGPDVTRPIKVVKEQAYLVGDPVLVFQNGKLLSGSVADPASGSGCATVLIKGQLQNLLISNLMPAFEHSDDVQVQVEHGGRQEWRAGRVLSEVSDGFRVECGAEIATVPPEMLRRHFTEGTTVWVYQTSSWRQAVVAATVVEQALEDRLDQRCRVILTESDEELSVPTWRIKFRNTCSM